MEKILEISPADLSQSLFTPNITKRLEIVNHGCDIKREFVIVYQNVSGLWTGFKGPEILALNDSIILDISKLSISISAVYIRYKDDCARIQRETESIKSKDAKGFNQISFSWFGGESKEETFVPYGM